MNKEQKSAVVDEVTAQIEGAEAIFAVDYRGLSVPQAAELRTQLNEAGATFRVVKNRLTKLAVDRAGAESLRDLLEGPTAFTFVSGDAALAAKAISRFTREFEILEFKGGVMGGEVLSADQLKDIARLPARDVLYGQFAGIVASPLTTLVRGLGSMVSGLAVALGQIAEQGLVGGGEAEEPPAQAEDAEATAAEDAAAEAAPETEDADEEPAEPETSEADDQASEPDPSGDDETDETKEDQ